MPYVKEPFEELDVMNYFMFNQLTTDKEIAQPFCKCMLKNLLGIEVNEIRIQAEKMEFPDDPKRRGVRLDVKIEEMDGKNVASIYDIEPHRDMESNYPKKNRFSQALIDKNNLDSGENDFSKLPDLFIICITNYDPFGYDQVLYTVKNHCEEVPELEYNDGVRILYFNTTGSKCGSSSLKQFLVYLEESREANVTDDATREVNGYVKNIKDNAGIGGRYMTVGNYIDNIVAEAVAEKDKALVEKDSALAEKDSALAEMGNTIAEKNNALAEKDAEIAFLKEQLKLLNA